MGSASTGETAVTGDRQAGASEGVERLRVRQVRWEAEGVISLTLEDPEGRALPTWTPGAHLDLVLPSGTVRQYSLCGEPSDRGSYTVAVLREADGRGGSVEIHDTSLAGRVLKARGPRNHFELVPAAHYVLIAGGIGITPVLAMVRHLERQGASWRLVYGGRSLESMAFVAELTALGSDRVTLVPQDTDGLIPVDEVLSDVPAGTAVYCCGPEGLLGAVTQSTARWLSPEVLHMERFAAAAATPEDPDGDEEAATFEVELRRSGVTLTVPPDRSILDVVQEVVPEAMSSCEEGFCGTCETRVLEGVPQHRDIILSQEERDRNDVMMICVGRSRTPRLVLDI
jgi:ferredoxin-NADP reductase